jgi:hypothetical protein
LRTRNLAVHLDGGSAGAHALLFVDFEHLGISRLTAGGQTFLFRHLQTDAVNPISWGTVFDALANQFSNSTLSPSSESLIRTLINQPSSNDLLLFSRPAAAADIQLTKQVLTDNGVEMVIDELQVEIVFESAQSSAVAPELDVTVTDDLQPIITLNRADLNGRQDGQGDFRRIFSVNTPVTLQAPTQFGEALFDRWLVNGQPRNAGDSVLALTVAFNTRVEARYVANATSTASSTASSSEPQLASAPESPTAQALSASASRPATATAAAAAETTMKLTPILTTHGYVSFAFPTLAGVRYLVEVTPIIDQPQWTRLETVLGTGELMQFTDSASHPTGFYRVKVEEGVSQQ